MKTKNKRIAAFIRRYILQQNITLTAEQEQAISRGNAELAMQILLDNSANRERRDLSDKLSDIFDEVVQKQQDADIYPWTKQDSLTLQSADIVQKILLLDKVYRYEIGFWRALVDFFPIPTFIIDDKRKMKFFNEKFIDMAGWTAEEIRQSEGAYNIFWPQDPANCPICGIVRSYSVDLKKSGAEETRMRSKDGNIIPVLLYVVPVYNDHGLLTHTFGIVQSRYEEINRRSQYLASEIEPIIAILNKIANRNIHERIEIDRDSELVNLEAPINQIIENLRQIIGDILQSSDAAVMSTQTVDVSLDNLFHWYNDTFLLVQKSLGDISQKMENSTSRIEKIISLIQSIADQTNLLSLNASIVANKAGEHGKGFAVVASEVRQLAQKSYEASNDVSQIIHEIKMNTKEMTQKIEDTVSENITLENYLNSVRHNFNDIQIVLDKLNQSVQAFSL